MLLLPIEKYVKRANNAGHTILGVYFLSLPMKMWCFEKITLGVEKDYLLKKVTFKIVVMWLFMNNKNKI